MGAARDEEADRIERLIAAMDRLAAKLDASSARAVTTRRVKAVRAAASAAPRPCSDIAAMKARRALARLKG
jgi:Tfp pilus assembly protein FimT